MTAGHLWTIAALVIGALVISLGLAGSQLAWHMAGATQAMPLDLRLDAAPQEEAVRYDTDAILALAPFGDAARTQTPTEARTTSLNLELRGIFVDETASRSRAFIAEAGRTRSFRIGETVIGAAVLTLIEARSVELDVNGETQRLSFPNSLEETRAREALAPSVVAGPSGMDRLRAALVPGNGSIDLREAPPAETVEDYIDLWRDRISSDPVGVMETIGLVSAGNGYTINENPNIGVTMAGLKPGDRVTRVNGQEVGDPDQDKVLYDEVAASGFARLEVVRGGSTLMMSFPLR